jgi:hypothetical protein
VATARAATITATIVQVIVAPGVAIVTIVPAVVPVISTMLVIAVAVAIVAVMHLPVMPMRASVVSSGLALVLAPVFVRVTVVTMVVRVVAEVCIGRNSACHVEPRVVVFVSLNCKRCREADENR